VSILKKIYYTLDFLLFYLSNLVISNVRVAADILTPGTRTKPGFIDFPLQLNTDLGLLLLSNLVAMTPGTLSIDISRDKNLLTVHLLFKDHESKARKDLARIQEKIRKMTESQ
jgi:multicomponent Na+:H+ antiporter subunit E